jgi:hypothetical protein
MVNWMRDFMRQPVNGYAMAMLLVVCTSLAVLGVLLSQANSKRVTQVVCEVSGEVVSDLNRRLAAYAEAPPSTASGQAQQRELEETLLRWQSRERQLGCSGKRG